MKLSQLQAAVGGEMIGGDTEFIGAAYDSREAFPGCLFVCLPGERTDGHIFINSAAEKGAVAAICTHKTDTRIPYLLVNDSLAAFQAAARLYAKTLDIPTVAVTGSVGKTTTKEFIAAVLSRGFNVYKTEGNKNSTVGLPATILNMPSTSNACVFEMGMSGFGEISLLSGIAYPDIAVISNIGFSHIEFLGSRENIMKAKLEILDGMDEKGILILNGDDEYLSRIDPKSIRQRVIYYGIGNRNAEFRAEDILGADGQCSFFAETPAGVIDVTIPTEGVHNVYNALSAIAVGQILGIDNDNIKAGLLKFRNAPLRQNIYEMNSMTVIEDCYNASPDSVVAAVNVLRTKNGRKIAVLGDMLELGSHSEELHEMTGRQIHGADILIAFGDFAESYKKGAEKAGLKPSDIYTCKNTAEASDILSRIAARGDVILFKASRGMHAEEIIANLKNQAK
jgi:UDP-N-acetylmuramoyl-tripeptide--D-alanyl-D-alanine ligase